MRNLGAQILNKRAHNAFKNWLYSVGKHQPPALSCFQQLLLCPSNPILYLETSVVLFIQTILDFLFSLEKIEKFLNLVFPRLQVCIMHWKGNDCHVYMADGDPSGLMMWKEKLPKTLSRHDFSNKHKPGLENEQLGCSLWWDLTVSRSWADLEWLWVLFLAKYHPLGPKTLYQYKLIA